jgi:predicted ribosome quality control (RQC) complex YloA/Tae2 family protein
MLRNYFTLYHTALELHERLAGGHLAEIYSEHKNEVCLDFITRYCKHLLLTVIAQNPLLCLSKRDGEKRKARHSANLMTELRMRPVTGVSISPSDREILIHFSDDTFIVLQLFSSKTNLFLVRENRITDAFKHKSTLSGQQYHPVYDSPGILRSLESLALNKSIFFEQFNSLKDKSIRERVSAALPGFDRTMVEELLGRTGKVENPDALFIAFQSLFFELLDPKITVSEKESGEPVFTLLHSALSSGRSFDSILDGLAHYTDTMRHFLETKEELKVFRKKLMRELEKKQHALDKFNPEMLEEFARNYERSGHLLMAALYQPRTERKSITVENIFEAGAPEKIIPLKETLTLQKNAEEYFSKASKTRGKIKKMEKRHGLLRKEKEQLEQLLAETENISSPREARRYIKQECFQKDKSNVQVLKKIRTAPLPFRTVNLTASITLFVGKNAANNDLLTFSHTKPNDIWLHARGAAGSHCVLKGTTLNNLGAIRQAAEIAAWYSAAKHSALVPVIYTLKKYVRSGKKFSPGQVIVEREEVLLVKPSNKLFTDRA